jgi:hypothetical protein
MSLRSAGLQFAVAMACSSAESAPAGLSRGAPNARGRLRTPPRTGLFQTGTWGFRSNLASGRGLCRDLSPSSVGTPTRDRSSAFERPKGQADARYHGIPCPLFFLGIRQIETVHRARPRKIAPAVIDHALTLHRDREETAGHPLILDLGSIHAQILSEKTGGRITLLIIARVDRQDGATVRSVEALTNALLGGTRRHKDARLDSQPSFHTGGRQTSSSREAAAAPGAVPERPTPARAQQW